MPEDKSMEKLEALKKAYISTFNSESGKEVLKDLERRCFQHTTTFSKDINLLAFNEGKRSVILHIKSMRVLNLDRIKELTKDKEE